MNPDDVLEDAHTILLVDWPTREVPDSLARAGYTVVSSDGPEEYNAYEVEDGEVVLRPVDGPPDQAELVYTHRPNDELPEIIDLAKQVGATTVWCQTDSEEASRIVESAGLAYVGRPAITDAVRRTGRLG